jgi:hypothetical protein
VPLQIRVGQYTLSVLENAHLLKSRHIHIAFLSNHAMTVLEGDISIPSQLLIVHDVTTVYFVEKSGTFGGQL